MKVLHIYCRVSTDAQVEKGHSLGAQEKLGIAKAESLGMQYKLYIDKGKSAAQDDLKNRPILQGLLDLCDEGKVTDIFATELDRLTRSPIVMYYIEKVLRDNKIMLHTSSQNIDLSNADDVFISNITALLSRRENTLRSKRSKRGMLEAVKKGKWIGVIIPYGYKKNEQGYLAVDPEEELIYKKIVEMSLAGNGSNTIANYLNQLGIQTRCRKVLPNGTKVKNKFTNTIRKVNNDEFVWRPGTIYTILTNSIYTGKRKYKGEIIPAPKMIDDGTWEKVQINLKKNQHYNINRSNKHFYLLRGLLRCGRCGANLFGRIKSDERTYMCSSKRDSHKSCHLPSPNLDKLEALVWEIVVNSDYYLEQYVNSLKSGNSQDRIKSLTRLIDQNNKLLSALNKRFRNLIMLFETERISIEKYDERKAELDKEVESVENDTNNHNKILSTLSVTEDSVTQVKTEFNQLRLRMNSFTPENRKEILNGLIPNIIVNWNDKQPMHIITVFFKIGDLEFEGEGFIKNGIVLTGKAHPKYVLVNAIEYINGINYEKTKNLVTA